MSDESQNFTEQSTAFQKLWIESVSKLMQAAYSTLSSSPDSTPPERLREARNNFLQALGESWNEFLRSPQFQQSMKQWTDNAVAFRKLSNDFMARVRKEMQAPSREDIDAIQLSVRHLETRILDRLEALSRQVAAVNAHCGPNTPARARGAKSTRQHRARNARRKETA